MEEPLRVLFLCTGNSARSQMAEALLRQMSKGGIEALSAGSLPRAEIHPLARTAMKDLFGLSMEGQYPKGLDYVISVCDRADASCPVFPGDTERIHWSFEDPAVVEGDDEARRRAFERTARDMASRIRLWMSLPAVASRVRAAESSA